MHVYRYCADVHAHVHPRLELGSVCFFKCYDIRPQKYLKGFMKAFVYYLYDFGENCKHHIPQSHIHQYTHKQTRVLTHTHTRVHTQTPGPPPSQIMY
eukprot:c38300_g1_i1 orf=597-887(+)